MEKDALKTSQAVYSDTSDTSLRRTKPKNTLARRLIFLCSCALLLQAALSFSGALSKGGHSQQAPTPSEAAHRASLVDKCRAVKQPAGPPASFTTSSRLQKGGNERWVPGTPSVLIKNARIWTGQEIIEHGDVFIEKGLVVAAGVLPPSLLRRVAAASSNVQIIDAHGRWLTPGLVDIHSHLGVYAAPALSGASDGNSHAAPILPWLRSVDALNTHDEAYELAIAGGVTTAQVLPGSGNNIGGQAAVIKLRETKERSVTAMVLEPPEGFAAKANGTGWVNWRHMKHACGENPDRGYRQTRMDGQWNFRNAYDTARKLKHRQDSFCAKVDAGEWDLIKSESDEFPEDLQWESLVDVLRGRVKLSIHCYEAVDLDGIVRLSNEFSFPVASFHHAGETYLVPDLLKKTWGGPPVASLFASNFKKKREAYRGSEFAPRVLAEHGLPFVMKSDHPVINSRYLMFEAQQAHYYGVDPILALASVTSTPAKALGLGHRIGSIGEGYDADLVLWDSHPLSLGATPTQVFIDGIAQLAPDAPTLHKSPALQRLPKVPNFDKEKNATVEWQGEMPLRGKLVGRGRRVRVVGVAGMDVPMPEGVHRPGTELETVWQSAKKDGVVILEDGSIVCASPSLSEGHACPSSLDEDEEVVDLGGGEIRTGLTTYGAPIGLVEIRLEPSTNDGNVRDPLIDQDPPTGLVHAVDGLAFEGRNLLLAYRNGITTGITAPTGSGFIQGVSTAFALGAPHGLANGAIQQSQTALHVSLSYNIPKVSVSTQVSALRKLLFVEGEDAADDAWAEVRKGEMTLVVSVQNADIMATLLSLKSEYEEITGHELKLTFSGATEAHLLADEIAAAGVSVILTKLRPYPDSWQQRRIMPGPPLSEKSALVALIDAGVNTALGVVDEAEARNMLFELAWASLDSNGLISKSEALALASSNLHKALGIQGNRHGIPDLVMVRGGGILDFESKVIGIISAARKVVELF